MCWCRKFNNYITKWNSHFDTVGGGGVSDMGYITHQHRRQNDELYSEQME